MDLPPLAARVFLVTGATDGIGKFTAELLAKEGCTVLIHGRNPSKVASTVSELQRCSNGGQLHGFVADLSVMSDVAQLAADVSERFPILHGLLNNAGTFAGDYTGRRKLTPDGNEYSFAVNVMAPFLLSSLLMGNVAASGAGRILVTSSISAGCSDALGDLQCERSWSDHSAYSLSKLCDAMLAMEMHERYGDPPRLCFHTMDPGTVDTKMLRAGWFDGGSSVRTARRSFQMLTEDRYQQSSGQCVGCGCDGTPAQRAKLWKDLEALTGALYPPVAPALRKRS